MVLAGDLFPGPLGGQLLEIRPPEQRQGVPSDGRNDVLSHQLAKPDLRDFQQTGGIPCRQVLRPIDPNLY